MYEKGKQNIFLLLRSCEWYSSLSTWTHERTKNTFTIISCFCSGYEWLYTISDGCNILKCDGISIRLVNVNLISSYILSSVTKNLSGRRITNNDTWISNISLFNRILQMWMNGFLKCHTKLLNIVLLTAFTIFKNCIYNSVWSATMCWCKN